jgi:hypothetical protein
MRSEELGSSDSAASPTKSRCFCAANGKRDLQVRGREDIHFLKTLKRRYQAERNPLKPEIKEEEDDEMVEMISKW